MLSDDSSASSSICLDGVVEISSVQARDPDPPSHGHALWRVVVSVVYAQRVMSPFLSAPVDSRRRVAACRIEVPAHLISVSAKELKGRLTNLRFGIGFRLSLLHDDQIR